MKQVRKVNFLIYVLMITLICTGCGLNLNVKQDTGEEFKNFKGYEAIAVIHFLKDNQENVLKVKQEVKEDGTYTLTLIEPEHLKDMVVSYDGEKIQQYHPKTKQTVTNGVSQARNETILTGMVESYKKGELKQKTEKWDNQETICFERTLSGNYKYLAVQKLWIDKKTKKPIQLVIYGEMQEVTLKVTYESFKYY